MPYMVPLAVWLRFDRNPPELILDNEEALRLKREEKVPVRCYVPNGSSVTRNVEQALSGAPRPLGPYT